MDVKFEITDNILIAILSGELDHHSAAEIRTTVDQKMDAFRARHLIFDFQGVNFMDSAGIGVVMGRYNRVKELGGKVYLVNCSDYVDRILEMAGIYTIAHKEAGCADAIETLKAGERAEQIPVVDSLDTSHGENGQMKSSEEVRR